MQAENLSCASTCRPDFGGHCLRRDTQLWHSHDYWWDTRSLLWLFRACLFLTWKCLLLRHFIAECRIAHNDVCMSFSSIDAEACRCCFYELIQFNVSLRNAEKLIQNLPPHCSSFSKQSIFCRYWIATLCSCKNIAQLRWCCRRFFLMKILPYLLSDITTTF